MISFLENIQKRYIHRDRKQIGGCHSLLKGGMLQWYWISFGGDKYVLLHRGSCGERAPPLERSWGRRLGIRKGGIEPQESPWKFSSIYPQNQSLLTFCFVLSPTPLTLRGAVPHYLSEKRVSLQLQLIIPGCDSVSTYKLLWKSSSLPE